MHQVKTFTYTHDNRVADIAYTNSVNPTPNVGMVWDGYFPRLASMTDGTGTTNYAYAPIGTLGGLKLASIAGPFQNDTIGLTYDPLGRVAQRNIPGGNESFGYDSIGRTTSHQGPLGAFLFDYLGQTNQMTSRKVTNGRVTVASAWEYESNKDDRRLRRIENSGSSRSYELSYRLPDEWAKNNPYDITAIKDISGPWHPFENREHFYKYDLSDRLLAADGDSPRGDAFEYDLLNNITLATHDRERADATYNNLNEMMTRGAKNYNYDGEGNTLSGDGVRTYKWDAENRIIEIDYVGSTAKSLFSYNGQGYRTVDTEVSSKGETIITRYLWCGARICQTRSSSDIVVRRDLNEGEYNVSTSQKLVYMQDQLGSVRDVLDAATGARIASNNYSPYGAATEREGGISSDYQYAGLFQHSESELNLATHRELDSNAGRWINRDPIRETGGINLYSYVNGGVTFNTDLLGLSCEPPISLGYTTIAGGPDANSWMIQWNLSRPSDVVGWIVQRVVLEQAFGEKTFTYWEAWYVGPGVTTPGVDEFLGRFGTAAIYASAQFYEGLGSSLAPYGFSVLGARPFWGVPSLAGSLLATWNNPNLPTTDATAPVIRVWTPPLL